MRIALENNLNTDLVYQLQWTNKPITIGSIQDYLANVANKQWVLEECLTKLSPDFKAMHALLDHGLLITDLNEIFDFNPDDVNVDDLQNLDYDQYQVKVEARVNEQREQCILRSIQNLTSTQRHFILNRQILLNYKEKLKLFQQISRIESDYETDDDGESELRFDYDRYERLRQQSYLEMAINYAHENNWKAIKLLFTHVGDSTLQHRLPILNNFPETLSPLNYQILLPACMQKDEDDELTVVEWVESKPTNQADWCLVYCRDIQNDLLLRAEEYELNFYLTNPDYIEYKAKQLNGGLLENWYKRRAREIEELSSLVNNSLTLISIGIKNKVPNLEQLKREMEIYHMIVYECLPYYNLGDISFGDYEKYSVNKKIDLLMCGATNKKASFVECFQAFLLPFLEKTLEPNSKDYFNHMHAYLLNVAKLDLNFIEQLFRHYHEASLESNASNEFDATRNQLFNDINSMVRLTVDCIYANSEPNQLEVAENILRCLPAFDRSQFDDLVLLENNLSVANFLSLYNYPVCVAFVKELEDKQDRPELIRIFRTVIKTAIQRLPPQATVFHLQEILNDLLEIRSLTFDSIASPLEINSLFVQSLLMSEKEEIFHLVREMMRINYDESKVEPDEENLSQDEESLFKFDLPVQAYLALIHECAADYVNKAESVNDNVIEVAKNCLKLAPQNSKLIQDELNFIQALQILNQEFDLQLLPVQIRLFPEPKIDIIINALKSFPKAYKKVSTLLKLGELFEVYAGKEQAFRDSKILSLIGDSAIKNQDYKECYFICKIIMDKEYPLGWEICRKLALTDEFYDREAKHRLLSYALAFCADDGNEISCIVDEIKRLKISLNENTTKKSLPDLIINKTQDVSGLIINTTQDVAQVTTHLTRWLIKNVIKEDDQAKIAKQYESIDKEHELEAKNQLVMDSLNIPTFYSDAFESYSNFKIKTNELDIDYRHYTLPEIKSSSQPFSVGQMLLRTHLLQYDIFKQGDVQNLKNLNKINDLLQELAYFALFHDTPLALSYLKSLNSYELTEKVFNQLSSKSPILVYVALYFYSLELCTKLQPKFDLDNFSIKDTVMKAEAYLIAGKEVDNLAELIAKYRKLFNDLMKADCLLSFYPEIDVNRFVNDEQYKRDTLLGLAMTEDDQTLENVKNLAIQYNVSLFEIYLSFLENLLTFSTIEVAEADRKIFENIDLMSALIERNEEVTGVFIDRIYPLISGSDYSKLILYYKILERINNDHPELKLQFVNHFKNLKKLKKCFENVTAGPFLDYKQLIEEKKRFVELLYPILNEANHGLLARWTITLKLDLKNQQAPNPSAVYSVWLRKKFLLNRPKWKDTYEECIETIRKLNANDYLHFINFYLLSPDAKSLMADLNEKFYYLESSMEYVKKRKTKGKKEEQQEWSKIEDEIGKIIELIND